jgi:hypothetical protein
MDRGGDRKKLLKPLLDRSQRFVIRSTGKLMVIDRKGLQGSVADVAGAVSAPLSGAHHQNPERAREELSVALRGRADSSARAQKSHSGWRWWPALARSP